VGGGVNHNMENFISKWGDKIKMFEVHLKEVNENLKVLNRATHHKKTEVSSNNDGIRDKIN
jgi:hypothetical protein